MTHARLVGLALALGTLLSAGGCSDVTCGPPRRCGVDEASCQAHSLDIARCYTGVDASADPEVRVRSVDALVDEYRDELRERPNDELRDERLWNTGLALLGLGADGGDLVEAYEYQLRRVAAYYDDSEARITVIADADVSRAATVPLLVHEHVHALQAARRGDDRRVPTPTTDALLASRAMTEGEAALYETFTYAEGLGFSLSELRDSAFESMRAAIGSHRPYDNAYRTFTYDRGAWWAVRAWRQGGADAVAALVAQPPPTSWHVMMGEISKSATPGPWAQQRREDFGVAQVPVLDPRFRSVDWDVFGAWMTTYLGPRVGESWVNDSFHVLHDDAQGETVAIWRITLNSRDDAKEALREVEWRMEQLEERHWDDPASQPFEYHDAQIEGDTLTWVASTETCDGDCVEVLEWTSLDEGAHKRLSPPVILSERL